MNLHFTARLSLSGKYPDYKIALMPVQIFFRVFFYS